MNQATVEFRHVSKQYGPHKPTSSAWKYFPMPFTSWWKINCVLARMLRVRMLNWQRRAIS